MERAGWFLTQGGGQFVAKDGQGQTVFVVAADLKGLYYLKNVTIQHEDAPVTTALGDVRGQRKFPLQHGFENSKASQFFPNGVEGKTCRVQSLSFAHIDRPETTQDSRYNTHSHLHVRAPESREVSQCSTFTAPSSSLSLSSDPQCSTDELARIFQGEDREHVTFSTKTQRFTDGLARRLQGEAREDDAFQTAASSNISPAALHPLSATHITSDVPFVNRQGGLSSLLNMPP